MFVLKRGSSVVIRNSVRCRFRLVCRNSSCPHNRDRRRGSGVHPCADVLLRITSRRTTQLTLKSAEIERKASERRTNGIFSREKCNSNDSNDEKLFLLVNRQTVDDGRRQKAHREHPMRASATVQLSIFKFQSSEFILMATTPVACAFLPCSNFSNRYSWRVVR